MTEPTVTNQLLTGTRQSDFLSGDQAKPASQAGRGNNEIRGFRGDDFLLGALGDDTLRGGRGNDRVFGNKGSDRLFDSRVREDNNDIFIGGEGNDRVVLFGGADLGIGGSGNDTLRSRSDAGEPIPAQDPTALVNSSEPLLDPNLINDTLIGGSGADRFVINSRIDARYEIAAKHADPVTGEIDWQAVAGENNATHDHWVESFGHDLILDFNVSQGDRIILRGHTNQVESIQDLIDSNGVEFTRINVWSDQGNDGVGGGGAHDLDPLGILDVYGDQVTIAELTILAGVFDGAYRTLDRFDGEDLPIEI